MKTEKVVREKPIPKEKIELVKEIAEKIKNNRTVLIASCKGLPGKQFHEIKKRLRGKAEIRVVKKDALLRAIKSTEKGALQELGKEANSDFAVFFSNADPFELSGILADSQSPSKAKAGDIAPEDIKIEPGPTELVPGPAISELGAVGLKVAVKEGKLEIQKGAVVAKKGEKINEKVAGVLSKLNISPMKVGFIPLIAYDAEEDKVFAGIKIDREETLEELQGLIKKALGLAINLGYLTDKTIKYFISKAAMEEKSLARIIRMKETTPEKNNDGKTENEDAGEAGASAEGKAEEKQEEDLNNQSAKEES